VLLQRILVKMESTGGQCAIQITMRMAAEMEQVVIMIPARLCEDQLTLGLTEAAAKATQKAVQALPF
jgi:hypothetical protein